MRRIIILLTTLLLSLCQQAQADVEAGVGGLIEIYYEKIGDEPSNLGAGDIEVNINAKLSDKVTGNILLRPDTPDEILEEATITLENFSQMPISITAGRTVMPFGAFNSHLITDPVTLENDLVTWETYAVGVIGGYAHKKAEVACAFYDSSNRKNVGAFAGRISLCPKDGLTFGGSYKICFENESEHADLSGMAEVIIGQVTIDAEYCEVTKRENDKPKPSAYSLGLAYRATEPLELALRYEELKDDDDRATSSEARIGVGLNLSLFEAVTISLEVGSTKPEEGDSKTDYGIKLATEF